MTLGDHLLEGLVSVVMAAFNSEHYIAAAIQSVLCQSYQQWELLVVDDASSDRTPDIVAECARKDARIRLLRQKQNAGPAYTRNVAIKEAGGRFIAFLDSDDIWLPNKLERQITVMQESGAVLSFTAYRKIDLDGNVGDATIEVPATVTYGQLLKTNVIACLTAIYDSHALGKMYMPEDMRREDYRLWLQILKLSRHHEDYALWLAILRKLLDKKKLQAMKVIGINEVLAYYRVHDTSVSRNKFQAAAMQWAVYRKVEGLSLWRSLYYFAHYAYRGYRKAKLR